MTARVAWLGTGLMGVPMARRLLAHGHPLAAWNRTPAKAQVLAADGAHLAATPAEAVAGAACVVTMLADGPATAAVLLDEAVRPVLAGRTVIQMGTIGVEESRALARAVGAAGADYLEAPVLGSTPQAQAGELIVMAGGDPSLYARWQPLLGILGIWPRLVGPAGAGAAMKLAMNQLIAGLTASFSASLGLVRGEGLDVATFMEVLRASALHAPTFDRKLPRMLAGDWGDPNFPTAHLAKDVRLFLAAAAPHGLATAPLAAIGGLLDRAAARHRVPTDYAALYAEIDPRAGAGSPVR